MRTLYDGCLLVAITAVEFRLSAVMSSLVVAECQFTVASLFAAFADVRHTLPVMLEKFIVWMALLIIPMLFIILLQINKSAYSIVNVTLTYSRYTVFRANMSL